MAGVHSLNLRAPWVPLLGIPVLGIPVLAIVVFAGIAFTLLAICASPMSRAQSSTPDRPPSVRATDHVRAELVAARESVAPGETLRIGLHQIIRPGWHTYWRNPGDSGLPTQLRWSVREGATVGATIWPSPERFTVGPIVNYGYGGEVVLLADLQVPRTFRPGEAVTLLLRAEWLVCEEICIPEEAELALTLPITSAPASASASAALIASFEARLPSAVGWTARHAASGERVVLHVAESGLVGRSITEAYFFPDMPDVIEHAAPQRFAATSDGIVLELTPAASRKGRAIDRLEGVLALRGGAGPTAVAIMAPAGAIPAPALTALVASAASGLTLWHAIAFALLGGILLNLMPCVLPVLSMKALALVAHAHRDRASRAREGLAYAAGVVVSFLAIAAIVLVLRAAGAELGWGFQFQSPVFVAALAAVMLAVGLSLTGVFHVDAGGLPGASAGLAGRDGGVGAFFTGLLAVVVATPCTAPFMGAALGVALLAPAPILIAILIAMAIGLALPFLILSLAPSTARVLPRPGAWMARLKRLLALPMYATCAWLVWVLSQQVSSRQLAVAIGAIAVVGAACWIYGLLGPRRPSLARLSAGTLIVMAAIAMGRLETTASARNVVAVAGGGIAAVAESFDPAKLAALRAEGRPVFVNMTAAWCITCIVNERGALASDSLRERFERARVAYLIGDWTQRDTAITAYLRSFNHGGVPLYVAYPAGGSGPRVLPQVLTEAAVIEALLSR